MANLGAKVRAARERAGLSQAELDVRARLTKGHTGQIERGDLKNVGAKTLAKIADVLAVPTEERGTWITVDSVPPPPTESGPSLPADEEPSTRAS